MAGMSSKDRWILSLYSWWRRFRLAPFNLSEIRKRPVRLLVCLPSNPEEAREAAGIIPELVACLGAESVFVVGEPGSVACCDLAGDLVSVVPLDRTARRWPGLPSARLVDRLSEEGLDFAVDLNPCAELLPTVLCLRIKAAVRLCLHDPHRERFFNMRILLADGHPAHSCDTGPGIPPDTGRSDPPLPGAAESPVDSPYIRLLRVIQSAAGPPSRPRIST